jgi:HSP20 family protein
MEASSKTIAASHSRSAKRRSAKAMATTHIPINVYREHERIMVSAPVPGMEPSNIHIVVEGRKIAIDSAQRGPRQDKTGQYIQEQWTAGPYHGEVTLPDWVDVGKANATYDNGVLVIIFPASHASTSGIVTMEKIGTSKGQIVGHVGKDLHTP